MKIRVLVIVLLCSIACKQPANTKNSTETNDTTNNIATDAGANERVNFVAASRAVMPAVVHIKVRIRTAGYYGGNRPYGGPQGGEALASGSGVLITNDGYIATNNHVVENADAVEVILPDKRVFKAEVKGTDPNTDLALIKIEGKDFPTVQLGNSDQVEVGQWVLAVGFPFSLNTTVTAGIVSAKARSIGIINQSQGGLQPAGASSAVESFIQTDAAINPGNSGGALVNTSGQLIGINSAIASQTGSYAGYAFAIPVNLAKKILDDLKQYGVVRRGVLGVSFPAPVAEDQYMLQQGLQPGSVKGVFITGVQDNSAADSAGLKEGDVIQEIDGFKLNSSTEFSERIARHKPGDQVSLQYLRNGKTKSTQAILKGEDTTKTTGTTGALQEIYNRLGATFAPLTPEAKQHFNINSGVLVNAVKAGGFFDRVGIPPGTIIAFVNGRPINSPVDINKAFLSARNGMIQILAIAPDGSKVVFNFSLGT